MAAALGLRSVSCAQTIATMRAIVANLDCELRWAQRGSPGPHKELPTAVRKAISELSQDLRIFGNANDILITLEDPTDTLDSCFEVLVWGQTHKVTSKLAPQNERAPWQERLWQLGCSPTIAAQCNDRRFCLTLELPAELELANVQTVDSIEALDQYIQTQPLGPDDAWVAKAPWAASGRERLKRRGRGVQTEQRVRATRLLQRYEQLVVEPWMKRIADFGVAGLIGESLASSIVFAPHQLQCDAGGVFRGIRINDAQTREMLGSHEENLRHCADIVKTALFTHGYRGPFGIDAFLYEEHDQTRLRAVCEINARLTFGLVARAHAEAVCADSYDFVPGC